MSLTPPPRLVRGISLGSELPDFTLRSCPYCRALLVPYQIVKQTMPNRQLQTIGNVYWSRPKEYILPQSYERSPKLCTQLNYRNSSWENTAWKKKSEFMLSTFIKDKGCSLFCRYFTPKQSSIVVMEGSIILGNQHTFGIISQKFWAGA